MCVTDPHKEQYTNVMLSDLSHLHQLCSDSVWLTSIPQVCPCLYFDKYYYSKDFRQLSGRVDGGGREGDRSQKGPDAAVFAARCWHHPDNMPTAGRLRIRVGEGKRSVADVGPTSDWSRNSWIGVAVGKRLAADVGPTVHGIVCNWQKVDRLPLMLQKRNIFIFNCHSWHMFKFHFFYFNVLRYKLFSFSFIRHISKIFFFCFCWVYCATYK